jgi:hypothetical protein
MLKHRIAKTDDAAAAAAAALAELMRSGRLSKPADVFSFGVMSEWTMLCTQPPLLPCSLG